MLNNYHLSFDLCNRFTNTFIEKNIYWHLGYIHTKPELSLSDLFFFSSSQEMSAYTKTTQNDVVYMPDQYVVL